MSWALMCDQPSRLHSIRGINRSAEVTIADVGTDLSALSNESAGKPKSGATRKGNPAPERARWRAHNPEEVSARVHATCRRERRAERNVLGFPGGVPPRRRPTPLSEWPGLPAPRAEN